jgi:VWFA-related protein
MLDLVRSLGSKEHVAIYILGRNLHVLQEFTDDPAKLVAAMARADPGRDLLPPSDVSDSGLAESGLSGPSPDAVFAEMEARISSDDHDRITVQALTRIVAHLSGIPGRRNLVWLKDKPTVPPAVMAMVLQNNIHLYPVLVRTLENGALFQPLVNAHGMPMPPQAHPDSLGTQRSGRALAEATGGESFNDAGYLRIALKTAEEDADSAYVIGYYPTEEDLDGKFHRLTIKIAGEKANHFELRYPSGYLAVKEPVATAAPPGPAITGLLQSPIDATAIGLTGSYVQGPRPGLYEVQLTLDVHDVHLERQGGRSGGKVELVLPQGEGAQLKVVNLDFTDDQLAEALMTGLQIAVTDVQISGNVIWVIVRDPSTGLAGSLKIPVRH